jgi:hypothetical protein
MPTNDELNHGHAHHGHEQPIDAEHPGYELSDVNVNGVAVFLAGLFGFVLIFFGVCFLLGRVINNEMDREDGQPNKWHGGAVAKAERENLKSNAAIQQQQLQGVTTAFPAPRLDTDDGNQATADLHAREDLLLNHYSYIPGANGAIRIPISRAMELIAQRGLPVNPAAGAPVQMAGDSKVEVQAPLTTGFARTGYELDVIKAREEKLSYSKAEGATKAEVAPAK